MKFSAKIFFATILIVVLSFSIVGYLLVSSLFHNTLKRETDRALDENRILRFSLETAFSGVDFSRRKIPSELVKELSNNIISGFSGRQVILRIYDNDINLLYESKKIDCGTSMLYTLRDDIRAYQIHKTQTGYFIQTACKIYAGSELLILESVQNITDVFNERDEQYKILQRISVILIFFTGIFVYIIARILTSPIKKLSRITKKIAGGNISVRANINRNDEIGMLAGDFNRMAGEIELRIHELEELTIRQEDFVASFAHELKTPLTSIIGYSDMLRSRELAEEDKFLAAGYIFSEGKRLESLSLKLLDLIVLKKNDFLLKEVNTKKLIKDVEAVVIPAMGSDNINFEVFIEEAYVLVEPDLFKTLLLNLLDNARKAIDENGKIQLIGKCGTEGYEIYIYDNGRGISSDDLPKITEAFYMADKSRSRRKGGAGLGLAICNEIIKLHKGTIDFVSKPGRGTIVSVFLKEEEK